MITFPHAKINLGLQVTERRPDGYHNLETLFYPVPLCDILEILPGGPFHFTSSGPDTGSAAGENLVVKAWKMMEEAYRLPPVRIHLHKVIPTGAGLGGGSSDAAATLKMVNHLFGLKLRQSQLEEAAARLGADAPFFIAGVPAFATGTGTRLEPFSIDLSGYILAIVKPPASVNTAEAYRLIRPRKPAASIRNLAANPVDTWKDLLTNDFEEPASRLVPETARIKQQLYRLGAVWASLTGSGSAVAGLFRHLPPRFDQAWPPGYFVYPGHSPATP